MTSLFLYTFYVGFGLTLVSFILGLVDLGGHGDLSHGGDLTHGGDLSLGGDISHGADLSLGGDAAHGGDLALAGDLSPADHGHVSTKATSVSPINFQTLVAALMGFGGIGYLVSTTGPAGLILPLLGGAGGAVLTGWLIYRFQRFLVRGERPLPPTSYTGIVGRLTVPIREGGTGEIVYTQHNSRMVSAARSHDGRPIERGAEVVILRYEQGVAYVQLWRELMDQKSEQGGIR